MSSRRPPMLLALALVGTLALATHGQSAPEPRPLLAVTGRGVRALL